MKFIPVFCLSLLVLLCIVACGDNFVFQQKKIIPNQQWNYQDSLNFDVAIQDTTSIYNLYIDIEHSVEYPKQNLYLQIHTLFPKGERTKQAISFDLADKIGQWKGDCSNEWCTKRVFLQENAYFNQAGAYTFTIEQYMRTNPLKDIKSISFSLEDTGQKR